MSNRYKKAVIEDVVSHDINPEQQDNLLDLFEYAMKSIATTLAREAKFNTNDFATAKQKGCEGFALSIYRSEFEGRSLWCGEFTKDSQKLAVIGSLE